MTRPKRKLLIVESDHAVAEDIRRDLAALDYDVQVTDPTEDPYFADSIDMLCVLGHDGHFRRLNPAWERTLGFTIEELQSRPFIEFVHPDDRERTLAQNARVRDGGLGIDFENRYLCKDGSYRWFHWNATSHAHSSVIYSMARDITAWKHAEQERERLVRELQSALNEVARLQAILPICSYCRKIRDDENYWHTVESYFARHTTTRFSHGICPECVVSEMGPHFEWSDRRPADALCLQGALHARPR